MGGERRCGAARPDLRPGQDDGDCPLPRLWPRRADGRPDGLHPGSRRGPALSGMPERDCAHRRDAVGYVYRGAWRRVSSDDAPDVAFIVRRRYVGRACLRSDLPRPPRCSLVTGAAGLRRAPAPIGAPISGRNSRKKVKIPSTTAYGTPISVIARPVYVPMTNDMVNWPRAYWPTVVPTATRVKS